MKWTTVVSTEVSRPTVKDNCVGEQRTQPFSSDEPQPAFATANARCPPVSPQKSRRYCTDFGLGHTNGLPSDDEFFLRGPPPSLCLRSPAPSGNDEPSITSAASTPLATYTDGSFSDDASSFYDELDSESPSPPTVGPALQRMENSPLFTMEETNAVKEFLRRRWGKTDTADENLKTSLVAHNVEGSEGQEGQTHIDDFSWEAESPDIRLSSLIKGNSKQADIDLLMMEMEGEALIKEEPFWWNDNRVNEVELVLSSLRDDVVDPYVSLPLTAPLAVHRPPRAQPPPSTLCKRTTSLQQLVPIYPVVPCPSCSVASANPASAVCPKPRALRFASQTNLMINANNKGSLDRIDNMPSPSTRTQPMLHKKWARSMDFWPRDAPERRRNSSLANVTRVNPDPPCLAKAGRERPSYKTNMSLASIGMGLGLDFMNTCADAGRPIATSPPPLLRADSAPNQVSPPKRNTTLGPPFLPRPILSMPDVPTATASSASRSRQTLSHFASFATPANSSCEPRSFIDITPEKLARRGSGSNAKDPGILSGGLKQKDRVKRLISRASNGVAGWGRSLSLTRKGSGRRMGSENAGDGLGRKRSVG